MPVTFPNTSSETNYFSRTTSVPSGNFTFCGWIYINSFTSAYGTIFYRGSNVTSGNEWPFFGISTSKLLHIFTGAVDVSGSTVLSSGTWYHVAVVRNASNDWKFYLNGAQEGSATSEGTNTNTIMALGSDVAFAGVNASNMTQAGVKIYSTNLSVAQIQQEMKSFIPATTTNLVAWLPMIATSVANCAIDYSGTGNFSTNGTPTLATINPPIPWATILNPNIFLATSGGGVTVTPSLFTGAFSNFSPTISGGANIVPSLLTAQFSNFAPLIIIQTTPSLITAAFSNFAPTISGDANISPTLISAAFSNFTPTIVADANVSPSLITAAFSAFNATVLNDTIIQPGMFAGNFSTFAPSIAADANVASSLITANFSSFSPSVVFDTIVQPNMFVGNFDVFAPAIQAGALIPIADLTEATFSILNPNINPTANVAKQTSARIWIALAMK